jgi:hypothetical protein
MGGDAFTGEKRMSDFSTTNWWPVVCLDCGINADLLMDRFSRIICRECHRRNEFNEVESPLRDFSIVQNESEEECQSSI